MRDDGRRTAGTPGTLGNSPGVWRQNDRSARDDIALALRSYAESRKRDIDDRARGGSQPLSNRAAEEVRRNCTAGAAEAEIHQGRCEVADGSGRRRDGDNGRSAQRGRKDDARAARFTIADLMLVFILSVALTYVLASRTNLFLDNTAAVTIHKQIVLTPIVNGNGHLKYRAIYDKRAHCDVTGGAYEIKGKTEKDTDVHLRNVQPRQYGTWKVGEGQEVIATVEMPR